jgi:hypothetical protein
VPHASAPAPPPARPTSPPVRPLRWLLLAALTVPLVVGLAQLGKP